MHLAFVEHASCLVLGHPRYTLCFALPPLQIDYTEYYLGLVFLAATIVLATHAHEYTKQHAHCRNILVSMLPSGTHVHINQMIALQPFNGNLATPDQWSNMRQPRYPYSLHLHVLTILNNIPFHFRNGIVLTLHKCTHLL